MPNTLKIQYLSSIKTEINGLVEILYQSVQQDASIGFVLPFSKEDAAKYWHSLHQDIEMGARVLFTAEYRQTLVGTAQLALCQKQNGLHRASLEKLITHPDYRKKGIGSQLIHHVEIFAKEKQRFLLDLDTKTGDAAQRLYHAHGYIEVGEIPFYARNSQNKYDATTIFYKDLRKTL